MTNTFTHDLSDTEVIAAFGQWLEDQGLNLEGRQPLMDGKRHYTLVKNRAKKKRKSGWYIGHLDKDIPTGSCGWYNVSHKNRVPPCFYFNLYFDFIKVKKGHNKLRKISEIDIEKKRVQAEHQQIEAALEEEFQKKVSSIYTHFEYNRSYPLQNHVYISEKKIPPTTARLLNPSDYDENEIRLFFGQFYSYLDESLQNKLIAKFLKMQSKSPDSPPIFYNRKDVMIILGHRFDQFYATFQYILSKKTSKGLQKFFPAIANAKHGSFHLIGPNLPEPGLFKKFRVILCEGWATGVAISILVKGSIPVLVCWDAGNIRSVATILRSIYYAADIWIMADNDHDKIDKGSNEPVNTGISVANFTAGVVGAYIAPPPFSSNEDKHRGLSDWQDYYHLYGYKISQDTLRNIMKGAKFIEASFSKENENYHQPILFPDRIHELPEVEEILGATNFTYAFMILNTIVSRGINEETSDERISLLYSHELAKTSYKISNRYEMCITSEFRKFISNFISDVYLRIEIQAIQQYDLNRIKPLVVSYLRICALIGEEHYTQAISALFKLFGTYNSDIWVESVLFNVTEPLLFEHPMYLPSMLDAFMKNGFYYHIPALPSYRNEANIDKFIKPATLTYLLVWSLNWPLNTGILPNLNMMPIKHMYVYWEKFNIATKSFFALQDFSKDVETSFGHNIIDRKINTLFNRLISEVSNRDKDIRTFRPQVLEIFAIVKEHPNLDATIFNMILSVFSTVASEEWSKAVIVSFLNDVTT